MELLSSLSNLATNHSLPLLHMAKSFIFIHDTNELISEFAILYIINPIFHVNKAFKDQVKNV